MDKRLSVSLLILAFIRNFHKYAFMYNLYNNKKKNTFEFKIFSESPSGENVKKQNTYIRIQKCVVVDI